MSSTYNHISASTSVVAQAHTQREHGEDLGLNNNTPFESSHLSPYNYSQTNSNSASPSYNINTGSTQGDSFSEYSNYQPSELSEVVDDEFFGVDFDAGVQRIDSLPSALRGNIAYHPVDLNHPLTEVHPQVEDSTEPLSASSYPLSPKLTSIPNTPSPRSEVNYAKETSTISQHELTSELHKSRFPAFATHVPAHPTSVQLTPDHSGSSHTSAEGLEPSEMARLEHSPHVTISQWGNHQAQHSNTFMPTGAQYLGANDAGTFGAQYSTEAGGHTTQATGLRDDEGMWKSSERTGQAGLDPEKRNLIANMEVPNLKEQEEQRRLDSKNIDVQEWRSQAGGSSDEDPDQSYFHFNNKSWHDPSHRRDPAEEDNDIPPVDDAASIRENQLVEGQVYYNFKNNAPMEDDFALMQQPRHWNDAPSVPYMTSTNFQPPTANDAIRRFNGNAETMSIASRAATWGTRRRRSEPSLADMDAVADGSFLKKLSISKSREASKLRQNSIFDQGLDRLANIVRNRSESKIMKRNRSSQNIAEEAQDPENPRHNSQGSLALPGRSNSTSRRRSPSINTAFAAMTGPLAAVGQSTNTGHTRGGSVTTANAVNTSPKSPTHLGFVGSVIKRARSRSELTTQEKTGQTGLVNLWRGHGGPPVANLASPPVEIEVKKVHHQPEIHDQDEDDDEDDEQADESDMKMESDQQTEPIVPNYDGFKAHVRRLNPDMDPRYNWLVSRIAHQQEIRYKALLDLRVKHSQTIMTRSCAAGRHCLSMGGNATLLDAKGNPRESEHNSSSLQLVTDFSDDSNPGEGALTDETFPTGVPMPPCRNLPAEFECQLCFKAKKFQKPSDWTKHVHEDVQPFTCTYDKCKEPKSFKRKADWVRHENERHRHLEWWICQVEDCRHPCYRKDNFLQHLVREHKLPEPKQKTKAAIKKARLTEPAWIMLERCHHETLNKPHDEPCKFCGKTFNTWKKLTVHLAKHMEHISLPVLRLVEARTVDANTIISPVEQILTPVTPTSRAKMESASPFNMDSISPHIPMVQQFTTTFDQPSYYPTSTTSTHYSMQASIPQDYTPNPMYAPNTFGVPHLDQSRNYPVMSSNNIGHMGQNQPRPYGSVDSSFPHTKIEHEQSRFGSLDAGFPHHNLPEQSYNTHQPSGGFSMPHNNYVTGAPAVSGYQAPNMLGVSDNGYGTFDPMGVNSGANFQQQVPMSRTPGSASSYGHSPQNVPQNVPYYGHQ